MQKTVKITRRAPCKHILTVITTQISLCQHNSEYRYSQSTLHHCHTYLHAYTINQKTLRSDAAIDENALSPTYMHVCTCHGQPSHPYPSIHKPLSTGRDYGYPNWRSSTLYGSDHRCHWCGGCRIGYCILASVVEAEKVAQ